MGSVLMVIIERLLVIIERLLVIIERLLLLIMMIGFLQDFYFFQQLLLVLL